MNQQVAKEMLDILGAVSLEFTDPIKVRVSPHSFPSIIHHVWHEDPDVFAMVNGEAKRWTELKDEVKLTISQRLRLLVSQKKPFVTP